MNGYNRVILAGNTTRAVELRYTPKGTAVAKLGLAVNRQWKDEKGELKEAVTFVDVTAWGKQAETLTQYVKKGRPLLIEGRLELEQWDDKETNEKRQRLAVVLESFTFLPDGKGKPTETADTRD
jgi:single-strand DNA-binding protein